MYGTVTMVTVTEKKYTLYTQNQIFMQQKSAGNPALTCLDFQPFITLIISSWIYPLDAAISVGKL